MIGNILINFLERYLVIFTAAILRHTCTPNVSPHGLLHTVLHIHVYEKTYNLYRSRVFRPRSIYNTKYMVTNSLCCYVALTIRLLTIWPHVHA